MAMTPNGQFHREAALVSKAKREEEKEAAKELAKKRKTGSAPPPLPPPSTHPASLAAALAIMAAAATKFSAQRAAPAKPPPQRAAAERSPSAKKARADPLLPLSAQVRHSRATVRVQLLYYLGLTDADIISLLSTTLPAIRSFTATSAQLSPQLHNQALATVLDDIGDDLMHAAYKALVKGSQFCTIHPNIPYYLHLKQPGVIVFDSDDYLSVDTVFAMYLPPHFANVRVCHAERTVYVYEPLPTGCLPMTLPIIRAYLNYLRDKRRQASLDSPFSALYQLRVSVPQVSPYSDACMFASPHQPSMIPTSNACGAMCFAYQALSMSLMAPPTTVLLTGADHYAARLALLHAALSGSHSFVSHTQNFALMVAAGAGLASLSQSRSPQRSVPAAWSLPGGRTALLFQ
jgi:hypothetical protein